MLDAVGAGVAEDDGEPEGDGETEGDGEAEGDGEIEGDGEAKDSAKATGRPAAAAAMIRHNNMMNIRFIRQKSSLRVFDNLF